MPWLGVGVEGNEIAVLTPHGSFRFDYVIAGSGYEIDLKRLPELVGFAEEIALWRHRYSPSPDLANDVLAGYPSLEQAFEFTEREEGTAPYLRNIHCFNYVALMSHGRSAGEVVSLKWGVPKLVRAIGRDLMLAEVERHVKHLIGGDVRICVSERKGILPVVDQDPTKEHPHATASCDD